MHSSKVEFILLVFSKLTSFGHCYFCQICYAAQVHKRTEPKMAIIDRMENKMALIHNYLIRHPSLFWLHTKEMVVISINRTLKNWQNLATKATKSVFSILNSQKGQILHWKYLCYWEYYCCTFCRFLGFADKRQGYCV